MTQTRVKRTRSPSAGSAGPRLPTLSDRAQAFALSAVARILGALGIDRSSALMGWLWRRLAPLNRRHDRAARHLAAALPSLTAPERRAILADMWENLGRTAAETFLLPQMIAEPHRFSLDVSALEPYREELARGAIFASLHQGNWEFAGWGIRLAGFRVAAVYQPLKNPLADALLWARRAPIYDAGLFRRETQSALRLRALAREGVAVGMLADLRDATGLELNFFGRPARVNALPAMLARRLDLPLVAGRVVRTGGAHFRIEACRIELPRTGDIAADIHAGTAALNACYEGWITDAPGQWMWAHRKWTAEV